ncbi:MAG: tRNA (guanine-N1)-methyltransferase [Flavobacterium sp.]|jgi:preprotein translocase subunit SecF|uniref:tRNA (guanine-N1)-methyltransferase n=1 Tax=Flavobacterium sp. TaxID=239 RepID=UPI003BA414C1
MSRIISLFFVFIFVFGNAQTASKDSLPASINGNLNQQFDYVFQKSNSFQEYKVIKKEYFALLKENSTDSVNRFKKELEQLKGNFLAYDKNLQSLKDTLATTKSSLEEVKNAQNNMNFFGISVAKSSYSMIMWGIVLALLFLSLIILFRFKNAKTIANESLRNFEKLEEDFEDFKRKSLEKEQKLGRQLQDEINKHKN